MSNKTRDERIIELLEELVKWQKVSSIPNVKALLESMIKTPEQKIAYSTSDGEKTVRDVSKISGLGKDTISKEWRKWTRAGIAEPIAVAGGGNRAKSLFSLEDLGIEVPNAIASPKEDKPEKPEEKDDEGNAEC